MLVFFIHGEFCSFIDYFIFVQAQYCWLENKFQIILVTLVNSTAHI